MLWFFSEPREELGVPTLGAVLAHRQRQRPSNLVWSGVDNLVGGTWRPPSFVEKLFSGIRDIKVIVIEFIGET